MGKEFDGVRAISDQPLWNGDYNARLFNTSFLKFYETRSEKAYEGSVPTQIAYSYDATIMALYAIRNAARSLGRERWSESDISQKRNAIRKSLLGSLPPGRVMSDSPLTSRHDVAVKLQRTVMKEDKLWIMTPQPPEWPYLSWLYLWAGAFVSVSLQVIVFYRDIIYRVITGGGLGCGE